MAADYLMYTTSALFFLCYIPDLYANYKNKNANIYNLPEKVIIFIATCLALSYSIINNNIPLITNYGPLLFFDGVSLVMRLYYVRQNLLLENNNYNEKVNNENVDNINIDNDEEIVN